MSKPYYRILWEETFGPIPVDRKGRSYEIHHINGNHFDDRIENLKCVSIEEHYRIHEEQGDMMACCAIKRRMDTPIELDEDQQLKLSIEASIAAKKRVLRGTHNFLGGEIQKAHQERRKQEGTHNFINSNPNFIMGSDGIIETMLTCIDKSGKKIRITKTAYQNQSGPMQDWQYVFHASIEGKHRKFTLQKQQDQI